MDKKWRLVISTRYLRERNNYQTEDTWTDTYDLAKGLEFYLPGHTKYKSYVKGITQKGKEIEVELITPIDFSQIFTSSKPLNMHYSDYRESCGDGIEERWDVAISIQEA